MNDLEGRPTTPPAAPSTVEHDVTIFAPNAFVTVTVERDCAGDDEIHFHAGGQGVWVARAVTHLGHRPVLCTPTGGEAGTVLRALVGDATDIATLHADGATASYVDDRRTGSRTHVARSRPVPLNRHQLDDLYGVVFESALRTGLVVVTGRPPHATVPAAFYRRLATDLHSAGAVVIGDLHGAELDAFLDGGPLEILKVSSEDLAADGQAVADAVSGFARLDDFAARGIEHVVLTRGPEPMLASLHGTHYAVTAPVVTAADYRGSGDATTGAFAVGLIRGLDLVDTMALGAAAGAASATRHGLATASSGLVASMVGHVRVEAVDVS